MESISLIDMAEEKLAQARQAHSGRAAHTIHGGHDHELRQTVLALAAGHELAEHDSPGEATLQVLHGHVRLSANTNVWEGKSGDYIAIPPRLRPRDSVRCGHDLRDQQCLCGCDAQIVCPGLPRGLHL